MQLLMSPPSPYARMARVAVRELGLLDRVEEVAVQTTPLDSNPQAVAANPTGRIPSLVREGAPSMYDSRVICRYLDHLAGGKLYPEARLWEVLTLEATGLGLSDSAIAMVYQARFVGSDGASAGWIEAQWQKVARSVEALEARWLSHLAGPLDAGQIAVGCGLAYVDFRLGARDWRTAAPGLAEWFVRFGARASMQETAPG